MVVVVVVVMGESVVLQWLMAMVLGTVWFEAVVMGYWWMYTEG